MLSEIFSFFEDIFCRLMFGLGEKFLFFLVDLFFVDLWLVVMVIGELFGISLTSEFFDCLLVRVDFLVFFCGVLRLFIDFIGEFRFGVVFLIMDCKYTIG